MSIDKTTSVSIRAGEPATEKGKRGPAKGQGGRPPKKAQEKSSRVKLTVRILPETLANIRAKGESAAQVLDSVFSGSKYNY